MQCYVCFGMACIIFLFCLLSYYMIHPCSMASRGTNSSAERAPPPSGSLSSRISRNEYGFGHASVTLIRLSSSPHTLLLLLSGISFSKEGLEEISKCRSAFKHKRQLLALYSSSFIFLSFKPDSRIQSNLYNLPNSTNFRQPCQPPPINQNGSMLLLLLPRRVLQLLLHQLHRECYLSYIPELIESFVYNS